MRKSLWIMSALLVVIALLVSACAAPAAPAPAGGEAAATEAAGGEAAAGCESKDPVTLQLKWVAQAQFAGYYAAQGEGFYDDECLEITINPGGPDIVPEQVVAGGQADFGINFVPSLLSAREQGTNLVNIAQVFERSAMREISWKDTGIESPADLAGKKVAVWFGGNEFELLATLAKYGIDKDTGVELIQQPFDMNLLIERQVDAAAAMTYNELAQVLETPDKDGNLYTLDQLNVIDFNAEGTAMLQDGVFVTEEWLADAANQDIASRFLRASFKGWMFCRDNVDKCVDYVLEQGPALPRGHQTWMMNEVNKLIWPSTAGIGQMDAALFEQTAGIAQQYGIIANPPGEGAYVTDYAAAALEGIDGDTMGADYQPVEVTLTAGGQ
ncbi:MAG: ABC transporter substrate-binding protein [Caldilinea sp.]|nr:ABC transporter substrate-binding protein [Caldilineaceae bacterium]MCB9122612.1 ABC transporter substrate-binding protein [Caldilineaceae bacterium]MCO5213968.1 ABC transporter substrate-binding protein [Caldilinea sp.]MCW5845204.1 ABC transporter substrate-binding protein [Caldilinea sp.]HRW50611.1 ABC transporter substrate-binding protein [Caldilinea sp.]